MWIIFKDGTTDQHAYPIENINAIFVTSNTNITVYARNPNNIFSESPYPDDTIALTCTEDTTDKVLNLLIDYISNPVASRNKYVIAAAGNIIDITTVAHTAGS